MWRETARLWIAVVAEWLRRLTRNQIPSGSVGSNPTDCGKHFWQPPSPLSFCNRYLVLFYTFPLMRLILSRPFFAVLLITIIYILPCSNLSVSIVGSVVECSPATRAARVRFPDDATFCSELRSFIDFVWRKWNKWEIIHGIKIKKHTKGMEAPGIDPGTSRMLSERSTIWATPPVGKGGHGELLYSATSLVTKKDNRPNKEVHRTIPIKVNDMLRVTLLLTDPGTLHCITFDSSVGRAVDCSWL